MSDLPGRDFYVQAKQNSQLIQPDKVAKFVVHAMLKSSNKEFSETEWNIYDSEFK